MGTSSKFYIPSLDGMRTVAFLIVFLAHAGLSKVVPGGFGVTVFFFLSGYLITTILRREYDRDQTLDFKSFYLRRTLRILPPFYFVLLLGVTLTFLGFLEGQIHLPALLSQALHYANYYAIFIGGGTTIGSGVYWSLAVEEHFYLLFPFLYLALLKLRLSPKKQMLVFWVLCLTILLWRCVLIYGLGVDSSRTFYASDTRMDSILFGCALAVNGNPMMDSPLGSNRLWKQFLLPLGIVLLLFSFLYRSFEFQETFRYSIQGIALYPIFVTAIRFPNWGLFRLLNLEWMRFIGLLSYSLYLVHHTVIYAVYMYIPQFHRAIQGGISLLISFGLAYAIYKFIEFPVAQIRKKLSEIV
jgi:peptidoglycan/LPS O-acetylase OafA/YrhL